MVQALGGIAVLIGVYFAWANLKTTQKAQTATQTNQADALHVTQEGQITDRFTKAIDQLGATDDKGNPRMELRLGEIYALESIANESPEFHWPIMEILTNYVRVHAPLKEPPAKQPGSAVAKPASNNENPPASILLPAPGPDIQAILTVIGRRDRSFEKGKDERLDLRRTNLDGADLRDAHLEGAILAVTHLEYAQMEGAHLEGANLVEANLEGAILDGVRLIGAHLEDADLAGAELEGALMIGTHLDHADLAVAGLENCIGLTQRQVNSAYGNEYTGLPPGIVMPAGWKHNP